MKKVISIIFFYFCICFIVIPFANASEVDILLNLLLKKGIITNKEYKELKQEMETLKNNKENKDIDKNIDTEKKKWTDKITLSGSLEGEFRWMKHRDITIKDSDNTTDIYLRKFELSLEAELTDWINITTVLNSEWIGDDINQGDEKITVDEATITFQSEEFPFYMVLGKKTQPFGLFENHLVTDPMTQDAYETKKVGVTVGAKGPVGSDISITIYKGEEQMNHLFESGLFDSSVVTRVGKETNDISSFILAVSLEPLEKHLKLFGAFLSEPGRNDRNETLNLGYEFIPPFFENLRLDGEYMEALKREKYKGFYKQFKEKVLSLTAAYEIVLRKREITGGGLFKAKRSHIVSEPLEIALRYEYFDDNSFAKETGSWSVKNRYSIGARYSFYNDEDTGLSAFVAGEFRKTDLRVSNSKMQDSNDEIYIKVGVNF